MATRLRNSLANAHQQSLSVYLPLANALDSRVTGSGELAAGRSMDFAVR